MDSPTATVEEAPSAPSEPDLSRVLGRDDILNADDLKTARVEVPEWGGTVIVKSLTAAERDHYENEWIDPKAAKKGKVEMRIVEVRARLAALTIVNEQGKRLFSTDDAKALGLKNAAAMNRVLEKARELSGMTEEDLVELAEGLDDGPSSDDDTA